MPVPDMRGFVLALLANAWSPSHSNHSPRLQGSMSSAFVAPVRRNIRARLSYRCTSSSETDQSRAANALSYMRSLARAGLQSEKYSPLIGAGMG